MSNVLLLALMQKRAWVCKLLRIKEGVYWTYELAGNVDVGSNAKVVLGCKLLTIKEGVFYIIN
jgi:hypothetical protein